MGNKILRLDNRDLGNLYAVRAIQTGIPAEEAERFANLIRTCPRQLYDAFRRRGHHLTGVREGQADLAADANQAGKVLLEQILAGLIRQPAAVNQFRNESEIPEHSDVRVITTVYREKGGYADIGAFADSRSTGARWNGHNYISDWKRFT